MQIETRFGCNGIIFISAPRSGEEGPSRRIGEDLQQLAISLGEFDFRHIKVTSQSQLVETLQSIESEIENGFRPIVHFDAHGSREDGLEIGATGEFVNWSVITEELRKLNTASGNNLFVFVAACFGFYLLKALTITKPCPFFIMFGPSDIVTFGEVESSVVPFYTQLFQTASVDSATQALPCKFEYFHAERMFLISFSRYIRENCFGKGGRARRENLLTEFFEEKKIENTKYTRRRFRKQIKQLLEPTPELMHLYAKSFMHDKDCSVSFAEVMKEVKQSYV